MNGNGGFIFVISLGLALGMVIAVAIDNLVFIQSPKNMNELISSGIECGAIAYHAKSGKLVLTEKGTGCSPAGK